MPSKLYNPPTIYFKLSSQAKLQPFGFDEEGNYTLGAETKTFLTLIQGYSFENPEDRLRGLETIFEANATGWPVDNKGMLHQKVARVRVYTDLNIDRGVRTLSTAWDMQK